METVYEKNGLVIHKEPPVLVPKDSITIADIPYPKEDIETVTYSLICADKLMYSHVTTNDPADEQQAIGLLLKAFYKWKAKMLLVNNIP